MNDLLLLHGALGAKSQFNELKELLINQFNVHSINFSGHGGEPIPDEPFSIELFAFDVLKWMDKNEIDKINIFGHSMGGYVGLFLAKNYPERINKVFTIATKFSWTKEFSANEVKMLNPEKIIQKVPKFANELIKKHGVENWKLLIAKTAEMMIGLGGEMKLTLQDFIQVIHEVWLGIGDNDKMVSKEETENVCSNLKKGKVVVFQNTPHQYEQMKVEVLAGEIKKFMKD